MTRSAHRLHPVWLVLASVLCVLGMWFYLQRVVIPHQIAEAAIHGTPRGNLSDLYPRWLGARELLLRGRDPYSDEVTREIQTGYYGRPLDPARAGDPKDEQRFAYPVYVVFPLAPTVLLRFDVVQRAFYWFLLLATMLSVPLWLRILRWSVSPWTVVSLVLFTLGSPAVMQGLKLRQLSLLVAAMLVAAAMLLVSNRLISAGVVLALATIKPQLVWLLLLWLAIWTAADWKARYRLAVSFLVTITVLVVGSEILLPHWIPRFWQALQAYQRYTDAASVLDKMISPVVGLTTAVLSVGMMGFICWSERKQRERSEGFACVLCLVLAVTVLVAPTFAPYNQILLLPAMLVLAREWQGTSRGLSERTLRVLTVITVAWPWITSILLAFLSFVLAPALVQEFWTVPFWSVWLIPVLVSASMLVVAYRGSASTAAATA